MPKQCPSCQQMLDDSASLCPICGAPVGHIDPKPEPVNVPLDQTSPTAGEPASVEPSPPPASPPSPFPPAPGPGLTKPALMAGVLLGVLSAMPYVNTCCLLWVAGAGVLAVYFLRTETPGLISSGTGASLGLLTGLFGSLVWQFLEILVRLASGPEELRNAEEQIGQMEGLPPEFVEFMEQVMEFMRDPLDPVFVIVSLLTKLILCGILTTLGGVLGAYLFGKSRANQS